jgi:hypothetical protein
VSISRTLDTLTVLVTPQAIWYETPGIKKELFSIGGQFPRWSLLKSPIDPSISERAKTVVFEFGGQIHAVDLVRMQRRTFEHHGSNASPQISPSSKYIAYLKDNEWEERTSLLIIRQDSTFAPLIDANKLPGQNAVKHFCWHPEKDLIFFVMGYAYGTITVGGSIYACDAGGNLQLLIPANHKEK